ncbi:MAG: hypothetical protein CL666_14610 [Balneola sp.]|nr:hypothetical protein [Balneola sp.]|tara:strand:+ start:59363 stop:60184 length:822 start_codon:yes stop_codon:yes gene_type:complete
MPKVSKGLPYFTLDTDLASDKRVKLLKAEFGIKGFGIWVELLRQIYADEGFFMKWDEDTKLLFASDVGVTGGVVDEVVNGLVRRGLFNESVFGRFNVLTSKHIQEKYFDAIKRRSSDMEVDSRLLVIDANADIIADNANIKLLHADIKQRPPAKGDIVENRIDDEKEEKESPREKNSLSNDIDIPEWEEWWRVAQSKAYTQDYARHLYDSLLYRGWKNKHGQEVQNWHSYLNMMHKYQRNFLSNLKEESKSKNNGSSSTYQEKTNSRYSGHGE